VRQISWEARYEGTQPEFTAPAVARRCQNYFAMSSPGLAGGRVGRGRRARPAPDE
jgi:hypothetical protein